MTSVTETEILKQTSNRVGTTFRERVEENGRSTEMVGEVTGYIQNNMISFHLAGERHSVNVQFDLEKSGTTTRLTQIAYIRFKSILRIMSLFTGPFIKKHIIDQSKSEFAKLKELCEQS